MTCTVCETDGSAGYLCQDCTTDLDRHLSELPRLYEQLADFLAPSTQRSNTVGGHVHRPDAPLPVDENVLDLRGPGGVVTVLETWRQALHEDAGWRWPDPFGDFRGRLLRAVRALRAQVPYVASAWPQAGLFATEVRALRAEVLSIVCPPEKTLRVGLCPKVLADGTACGAVLRATPGNPEIRCRWCDTAYPPSSWLGLARQEAAA
jgi:hypothetical protein